MFKKEILFVPFFKERLGWVVGSYYFDYLLGLRIFREIMFLLSTLRVMTLTNIYIFSHTK